jgi:CMP-N,N'-diacetyllegionaminic acid synthase
MINNQNVLAVITARGNSKRLPNKNILDLNGKPLIAWTIEAALKSGVVNRLIVSTDDIRIAEISRKFGADVPFMRPNELSSDTSKSIDVVFHVIDELENSGVFYKYLLLLQPTSPLRNSHHIAGAFEYFKKKSKICC